jgi:hypothetical protein
MYGKKTDDKGEVKRKKDHIVEALGHFLKYLDLLI